MGNKNTHSKETLSIFLPISYFIMDLYSNNHCILSVVVTLSGFHRREDYCLHVLIDIQIVC